MFSIYLVSRWKAGFNYTIDALKNSSVAFFVSRKGSCVTSPTTPFFCMCFVRVCPDKSGELPSSYCTSPVSHHPPHTMVLEFSDFHVKVDNKNETVAGQADLIRGIAEKYLRD